MGQLFKASSSGDGNGFVVHRFGGPERVLKGEDGGDSIPLYKIVAAKCEGQASLANRRLDSIGDKKPIEEVIVFDGHTTGNSPHKRFRTIIVKGTEDTLIIDTAGRLHIAPFWN